MNFHVLTLFPEMIEAAFSTSITGRAMDAGLLSLHAVNIRDYAEEKRKGRVDDYSYGGGAGMIMQAEPVYRAYCAVADAIADRTHPRVLFMTPQGRTFDQAFASELAKEKEAHKTDEEVLSELKREERHFEIPKGSIQVKGIDDVAVRFSKCCSPVPGDEIVGFITRGRGVSIHRTDCINVLCMEEGERTRLIDAEWIDTNENGEEQEFTTEINIYTVNRQGIVFDISKIFNEAKINLKGMNVRINKQGKATITMQFGIKSTEQLSKITAKIRLVDGVIDIERTRG